MKTCRLALTGLVAAIACVAPALGHVVPLTAQELVFDSHDVVVASVLDETTVRIGASKAIVTRYRLAVEENLRGETPHEITVEVFGGTLDGETQETCMTVTLAVGSRYVLFVNDPKNPGFSTFTGAQQGVVKDPGSAASGPATLTSMSGPLAAIAGDKAVTFAGFVDLLRAFVKKTEAGPAPPARATVVHDPPLPAKRVEVAGDPPFDPTPVVPFDAPASFGPLPPAYPDIVHRDASYIGEVPRVSEPGVDFSYSRAPARYIVWNEWSPAFAPWAGRDQSMMVRWNTYGDIFRVSGSPTGGWQWANNVFDIAGFVADPSMYFVFGRTWGAGELAVCFTRWPVSGTIIEADIFVNPAFPWTLDNELGTRQNSGSWGIDQTLLHELGHSWGLAHPFEVQDVWWDSVMNYSPKEYRFPEVHADDAAAIRSAYPGIALHDGLISFYRTQDQANNSNASYVNVDPITHSVQQMGSFQIWDAFKVENVGTDTIVNPRVDVYLTHTRMSWSAYEYLQSLSYAATMPASGILNLSSGNITVPFNTPPGEYAILLWLYDALDSQPYNNEAWSTAEYNHLTITSYPWTIAPQANWQFQQVRTAPYGSYDFYFPGVAGTRVDISTCPADGGSATFDTILDLSDIVSWRATSDDACGSQSRISWLVQTNSQHHIVLRGWTYSFGTSRMQYRLRTWAAGNLHLSASKNSGAGTVGLSWAGDVGPYDVQRSTTPNFASPELIGNGQDGTTLDDPVLASGQVYYYRVR